MDRTALLQLWTEWWEQDTWIASWTKAISGLTPDQAAWQPTVGGSARHSIWQNVTHVAFWREVTLASIEGKPRPADDVIAAQQFAQPKEHTAAAWAAARERLAATQRAFVAALQNPTTPLDRITYHFPHDAYHLGQIMYVRAMLGLAPAV